MPISVHSIIISSFGYKHGVPNDADILFDCRELPNPFWEPSLRNLTGKDEAVIAFLDEKKDIQEAVKRMESYLDQYLALWKRNGMRRDVHIYLGCTGGQHRSVYLAERIYQRYVNTYPCNLNHRELFRYQEEPYGPTQED